jgi:S-formylglutathione hydrolase
MDIVSENKSHGGRQLVVRHASSATSTDMIFSIFLPPQAEHGGKLPVVWYLSGLTCTHANVTEKGEYRAACAELGLIFVAPDTSPRGPGVPTAPDGQWDFGLGAGFYVDATEEPWARHYRMWNYVTDELPRLVAAEFPVDMDAQAISGHSMGGHGALTVALSFPDRFRSVSAFAPIVAPGQVFMPFHFAESNSNLVTLGAFDPISREPNFKQCAVTVQRTPIRDRRSSRAGN